MITISFILTESCSFMLSITHTGSLHGFECFIFMLPIIVPFLLLKATASLPPTFIWGIAFSSWFLLGAIIGLLVGKLKIRRR